jgi:hypothetical protein
MNVLIVLFAVQFTGIFLACIYVLLRTREEKQQISMDQFSLHSMSWSDDEWPWLMKYFQDFPNSSLKEVFPHFYKFSIATKKYKELICLEKKGLVSEKQFRKEMQKLLPFLRSKIRE